MHAAEGPTRSVWLLPAVVPGFLKLFTKSVFVCMYVCMHVCMNICLSFHTHVSKPFTSSLKAACKQTIKAKQSLHYTHALVSFCIKGVFLSQLKTGRNDFPQTSKPAFLVNS